MGVFSAIASTVGTVASAIIGSNAAGDAADAQRDADVLAIEEQRAARAEASARISAAEENFQPFLESGIEANTTLRNLLTTDQTVQDFEKLSPGFNFRVDQGEDALENLQRKKGLSLSGAAVEEFLGFNQDIASSEFDVFTRRLFGLSEQGRGAAGAIGNLALGDAGQIAGAGVNVGNILQNTGTAEANAEIAGANAITGGINTGVNNIIKLQQQQELLDVLGQKSPGVG